MNIQIAQLNYIVGDFEGNSSKIITAIQQAKNDGVDLIIFSELALCGYPPLDLLEYKWFIEKNTEYLAKIAGHVNDIEVIVGAPAINQSESGKALFNAAYLLSEGKVKHVINKTLLPTYDIFDEYRYFEPNRIFEIIDIKGKRIALTICEDLWFEQPVLRNFGKSIMYVVDPLQELMKHQPDIIINIAASPFSYTHQEVKQSIFTRCAAKHKIPLIYVNQVGAHTELVFDGGSMIIGSAGNIIHQCARFTEDRHTFAWNQLESKNGLQAHKPDYIRDIYNALVMGIRDYFGKMGFSSATLGLSGGIDSAVTLVLAQAALGSANIRVLLMPSEFSSDHSVNDARKLAENLGVKYDVVPIHEMVEAYEKSLSQIFSGLNNDITEENIQARVRGTLLMAISNKFGNILLNTSNKSETAVGYGTLYGDMNGGISVLGDVYKSDVYKLARYINSNAEIIPENTITKPPSAELRPDQKDTDSLPDYEILDNLLFYYVEQQMSVNEIITKGYDAKLVHKVVRMVNNNEYKRFQTPPILRVTSKAFGIGRKMPLVAKYLF